MIDQTIDANTYARSKEKMLLERAALLNALANNQDLLSAPTNIRNFLELAKSLTGLYQTLTKAERRKFVQSVTSNRLVYGKNLQLEPSQWLKVVSDSQAVPFGAPSGPKTRTGFGVSYTKTSNDGESNSETIQRLVEASVCEEMALMKDIVGLNSTGSGAPSISDQSRSSHHQN